MPSRRPRVKSRFRVAQDPLCGLLAHFRIVPVAGRVVVVEPAVLADVREIIRLALYGREREGRRDCVLPQAGQRWVYLLPGRQSAAGSIRTASDRMRPTRHPLRACEAAVQHGDIGCQCRRRLAGAVSRNREMVDRRAFARRRRCKHVSGKTQRRFLRHRVSCRLSYRRSVEDRCRSAFSRRQQ